jgi:putative salt-induced outer membrane protein YdiY
MQTKQRRVRKLILFLLISVLTGTWASAQEENPTEENNKKVGLYDNWSSKLTLGASTYSGNVDKSDFRGDFNIKRSDEFLEVSASLKAVYSEVNGTENNKEYYGGIKLDYKPENKITPFAVFSAYQNIPKGYDSRLSGMLGGKWVFYKSKKGKYSISAAFQFDSEKYVKDVNDDGIIDMEEGKIEDKNKMRLSIRPKIKQHFTENLFFEAVMFIIPNLTDAESFEDLKEDYIIDFNAALTNKLTEKIYLKFSYDYDYVKLPPREDIENKDQAFIASIVFKF